MTSKSLIAGIGPLCQRILAMFPRDIAMCFAYGSAVYPQSTKEAAYITKRNVIDLVFVVPNTILWHEENIRRNPNHYSRIRYLGHQTVSRLQESYGAGVYYNTLIPFEDVQFKYGVISQSALVTDLLDWSYLYISGRLHKPVLILQMSGNGTLRSALQINLHSAVHAALLMLPVAFQEKRLYQTITGLSYHGDFRMIFGEDRNKINNIVHGQMNLFRDLYSPVIKSLSDYVEFRQDENMFVQDPSTQAKLYHLNQLPKNPTRLIVRHWNEARRKKYDTEDVLMTVAQDLDVDEIVKRTLQEIVWYSSIGQSLKGIYTAGIIKSIRYAGAKLTKMFASKVVAYRSS